MLLDSQNYAKCNLTPRAPHRTLTACGRKLPIGAPEALSRLVQERRP